MHDEQKCDKSRGAKRGLEQSDAFGSFDIYLSVFYKHFSAQVQP